MEYVKGETLEAVLDREKSLDVPRALTYAVQILKGVEHAHEAQILHRDLRPANVLISESGALKVADFGTSRLLESSHATTVIGSPPYMAPEAVPGPRGARVGHLLGRRDDLPDADRECFPTSAPTPRRSSASWPRGAARRPRSRTPRSRARSPTS